MTTANTDKGGKNPTGGQQRDGRISQDSTTPKALTNQADNLSVHGCLGSCGLCRQGCTICHPCDPLKHGGIAKSYPVSPITVPKHLKCDLCGSTAIDHTEMHCQLNRFSQRTAGNDLAASDQEANTDAYKTRPTTPPPSAPQEGKGE